MLPGQGNQNGTFSFNPAKDRVSRVFSACPHTYLDVFQGKAGLEIINNSDSAHKDTEAMDVRIRQNGFERQGLENAGGKNPHIQEKNNRGKIG